MSADDFDQIVSIHEQDEDLERIKFEEIIQQRLADKGFNVTNRLSVKEIMAKITRIEKRKKDLVKQITQFINKAQKLHLSPIKIREIAEAEKAKGNLNRRNECFVKIAIRVYDEYQSRLKKRIILILMVYLSRQ